MLLTISGYPIPEIVKYTVSTFTITDSARNDSGNMVHEYITKKQKLSVEIGAITTAQKQAVYNAINVNRGLNLSAQFLDPDTGAARTMNCYIGDRVIEARLIKNGRIDMWSGLTLSLIEN